jgi:hypothetical protein
MLSAPASLAWASLHPSRKPCAQNSLQRPERRIVLRNTNLGVFGHGLWLGKARFRATIYQIKNRDLCLDLWVEARAGIEPACKDLQSSA